MHDFKRKLRLFLIFIIWTLSVSLYFHQYYLRVSISGLSESLSADFLLKENQLANLEVYFFLAYSSFLPVAGVLIDRFGTRKILPLTGLGLGVACYIFSSAHSINELIIARLLMGGAASFSFLGAIMVIRNYFAPSLFPLLSGLMLTIGVMGAY